MDSTDSSDTFGTLFSLDGRYFSDGGRCLPAVGHDAEKLFDATAHYRAGIRDKKSLLLYLRHGNECRVFEISRETAEALSRDLAIGSAAIRASQS